MLLINRNSNSKSSAQESRQHVGEPSLTPASTHPTPLVTASSDHIQKHGTQTPASAPLSTVSSITSSNPSHNHNHNPPEKKLMPKLNFGGLFKRLGGSQSNTNSTNASSVNVNINGNNVGSVLNVGSTNHKQNNHPSDNVNINNDTFRLATAEDDEIVNESSSGSDARNQEATIVITSAGSSNTESKLKSHATSISSSTTATDDFDQKQNIVATPKSILDDANHITIIPSYDDEDEDIMENEDEDEDEVDEEQNSNDFANENANDNYYDQHLNLPGSTIKDRKKRMSTASSTLTSGSVNNSNLLTSDYINNYTHHINDQERYTSFTAECISLQNSEMTSHLDVDSENQSMIINTIATPPGDGFFDPSQTAGGVYSFNTNSTATSSQPNSEPAPKHSEDSEEADEFDEYDSFSDPAAYLSESESDLNFDPKNEENEFDYKVGGYHPVTKGETYYSKNFPQREYIILRKLGWGHFSTVWLAKSRYNPGLANVSDMPTSLVDTSEYYVAIKFVKSNKNYLEAAEDEIKILKCLNDPITYGNHLGFKHKQYFSTTVTHPQAHPGYKHIMTLIDDFQIVGPHGNHICMVFEILGENVLNLIYKYKQFYNNVQSQIKKNSECPSIQEEKYSNPESNSMKFSKWDTRIFSKKKNSKSMLSLGLNLKKSSFASESDEDLDKKIKNMNSESLMKLIEKSKQLSGIPLNLVRQIVKQILLGMDYMHHCGVIHTDLKPENILIEIKDIDKLIKSIEHQKVSKMNSASASNSRRSSLFRKNSSNSTKVIKKVTSTSLSNTPRNQSLASNNSIVSNSFYYKKSKNSALGKYESPIRSSKPLCSSISSDIFFKDVEFQDDQNSDTQHRRTHSLPKTIKKTAVELTGAASLVSSVQSEEDNEPEISIKIADLGNATFTHHHFTNQIQTRQYRSPEIILKYKTWGSSTDLWSIGCIIFELITGDYLFDPHDGKYFDKDEDHLAQIVELLGAFPSDEYLIDCKLTSKYFKLDPKTNQIIFKNIDNLKFWGLEEVFIEKYKFKKDDIQVKLISDLILKCLRYGLDDRYDCRSLINHPWLRDDADFMNADQFDVPLEEELQNMLNIHDDFPGYTCVTCEDMEEGE
ncbi:serine kinase that phosphoryates SR family splicing factors [Scheffersomyces stipitis CBS 6054]|uniref:non-specific serine/threonine protein kinase n=1 Tax=Scheffersomyces stipitis (strain ATCC 58785 / CBS 6054 / NBRC 10063 / NRRL Y-11545) TaxID=322104 RepID=A3LTY0_PICST|nr:serine kinase that phosphoryates SR family splicing factors [Scheffersomyces stipitis CBS 6054]ABN66143.2 serine kinase that phosphoryates SR family splicing factors [Scheffersomyces stipitis CBS 6054]